jgi:hypothetical protein
MHIKLPHSYSQQEAITRVKTMLAEAKPHLADKAEIQEERWDGDVLHFAFTAQGQNITGQLEVTDKEFVIDAKLPLMLRMFEGKIQKMIQEQGKQMLG